MAGPRSALEDERRELERDREFLRAVADASPNLLVVIDDTATVAGNSVNKGFERAIGWTEQEMLGRSLLDLFAPEDRDVALLGVAAALNGLEPMERVGRWRTRAGVAESLTNVAKYAQASEATVCVRRHDGRVLVEVSDDGVGGADVGKGSGLRGLADRVAALGGTLVLESVQGDGTRIRAEISAA